MADLSGRFDEMVAATERQGLLVFPGYVAEDLPTVWWQGNPDDWPDFLGIAKTEGARTLFVGRAILEAEDLQEIAEWVEEKEGPGPSNGDRARLKTFERYIGLTGEVRLGWIKEGVAFVLQQQTEWYAEFLDLMEEVEEEDDLDD
ncbi:MAG: hypothetical protein A2Z31_01300 [candidate division NC10 bacterium RBG_16_65_8]|nr:MAG: hypothetical protein A2Z31_01300 [candidate division NC10 bacterium RBG_16_65_8]